eukprot:GHVS01014801.1.p1 GENE.GHVS01014801.1~~GHVS01014801.1.p1  ORF type:complete len:248 (-),score=68.33 GHVS01014801.1:91-834(-)
MGAFWSVLSPPAATNSCSNLFTNTCCSRLPFQVYVSGPAQGGKTTIVKWLKYNKYCRTQPTDGIEVESVNFHEHALVLWDCRPSLDPQKTSHKADIRGLVYVVDSADPGRLRIAHRMLDRLVQDCPDASVLLVFASKQDRQGALSVEDIQTQLMLADLHQKECAVFGCSGKTGAGIDEGMLWLCERLSEDQLNGLCGAAAGGRATTSGGGSVCGGIQNYQCGEGGSGGWCASIMGGNNTTTTDSSTG